MEEGRHRRIVFRRLPGIDAASWICAWRSVSEVILPSTTGLPYSAWADRDNMVREALGSCEECEEGDESLDVRTMLGLAIATSIDALAVGVTFAFLQVQIVPAVCFIGGITFTLSAAGVKIGNIFGTKYKSKAELAGGVILILMGGEILLEHLGILF